MKLYFSTNQFDQLSNYSFKERQEITAIAQRKVPATKKFVLNLLKLAILIPPFMLLANLDSWWFIIPLVFVLCSYFIVLRPLSLTFMSSHIDSAISEFEKLKSAQ